jgi:hypothetical protein
MGPHAKNVHQRKEAQARATAAKKSRGEELRRFRVTQEGYYQGRLSV